MIVAQAQGVRLDLEAFAVSNESKGGDRLLAIPERLAGPVFEDPGGVELHSDQLGGQDRETRLRGPDDRGGIGHRREWRMKMIGDGVQRNLQWTD